MSRNHRRALGYQPVDINASDTRNKADSKITGGMAGKLANAVKEMCTNTAIGSDAQGRRKRVPPPLLPHSLRNIPRPSPNVNNSLSAGAQSCRGMYQACSTPSASLPER